MGGRFYEKKTHNISKPNFLEMFIDAGAMNREDMGEYINPTGEDLDLIEILPINDRHLCSYYQEVGNSYVTPSLPTMKWHFRVNHAFIQVDGNMFLVSCRPFSTITGPNIIASKWILLFVLFESSYLIKICRPIMSKITFLYLPNNSSNIYLQTTSMSGRLPNWMIMVMMQTFITIEINWTIRSLNILSCKSFILNLQQMSLRKLLYLFVSKEVHNICSAYNNIRNAVCQFFSRINNKMQNASEGHFWR